MTQVKETQAGKPPRIFYEELGESATPSAAPAQHAIAQTLPRILKLAFRALALR